MKTNLLLSFLLLTSYCLLSTAQIPQGFNYQAIARDGSGNPILNASLPVTITIQSDSLGGTIFWKELHSSIQTNGFGLFTLVIGKGAKDGSSTVATFSDINWSVTPKFIKTEIYYQLELKNMGSSRLLTVPYSMVAGELGGSLDKLEVAGKTTSLEEALFEVKNKDGQTVFAVYNEGVRIYVDDGAKSPKGGFAIGGFGLDKGNSQKYLFVSADSIRAYIGPKEGKSSKGGFVIGGFDNKKQITNEEYLRVTRDSTRVYIDDSPSKVKKGGFAIGGFDFAKNGTKNFLNITPDSTRIYVNEPESSISKNGFSVRGRNPVSNIEGDYMSLGRFSSQIYSKSDVENYKEYTSWNLLVGNDVDTDTIKLLKARLANLSMTIPYGDLEAKGEQAKFEVNTTNTMVKEGQDDRLISIGLENILIGTGSRGFLGGYRNILIGNIVMNTLGFSGRENVILGFRTVSSGDYSGLGKNVNNVLIGSGMMITGGSDNVCIGDKAGSSRSFEDSNKLYIENSAADKTGALIYGEFDTDKLSLNARVTVRDALQLQPRSDPPAGPLEGEIYYNSASHKLFVYDGTTWQGCW